MVVRGPVPLSFALVALLTLTSIAAAENWPGWRGPRGDGTSDETRAPQKWHGGDKETPAAGVVWKTEIPGTGHSSPIVWNDRVFIVTCLEDKQERRLLCLDRKSGQIVWQKTVLVSPLEKKHQLNSFASSTPATDGKLVYCTFLDRGEMVVAAYDFTGAEQWVVRPGKFSSVHGYCSCPVLFEGTVIVNGDHDGDAYIVALNRADGRTVWKIDRENKTRSYSTPIIRDIAGRTQMILTGSKCVASYDPRTGDRHWIIDGPTQQFVASVVYNGDLLFLTAGFPEYHMLAIDPKGSGNVTKSNIAWRTTEACSYVPSPIAVGPYFLVVSDTGIASCFEAKTGQRLWKERIGRHYSGSLVTAGGLVYFTDDDGITKVVKPGEKFTVVAENHLGEAIYSSPAISQGQIFLRGEKHLFCLGD